eukprot:CAMPEP_0198121222 /NCGR_PEP_ID=MMETSP1442-20131203/31500_1 /TAXON_ID= /ORGANISM="Craspedostauros australis, Strain CCMP3328" /LENGTH=473 /DNA_ID=CAMNT_0043779993 /DNA_START=125 /DNA_END=1546 /DNA_ORIENTATION=+
MAPSQGMISPIPRPLSVAGKSSGAALGSNSDVIDKASFFAKADSKPASASSTAGPKTTGEGSSTKSNWNPKEVRPVPPFYPLERSSRLVQDDVASTTARLSEANRVLSVHADYDDETASAQLKTAEGVEMHLSLWHTGSDSRKQGTVVELQRRKGDSIAFHRYSRFILDAAVGEFDPEEHVATNGVDLDLVYSNKIQRMLTMEQKDAATEQENAIIALEIAHGLLMKDRMDARRLGLESLCLLTDPNKTGLDTALLASHVVLLGSAQLDEEKEEGALVFNDAPFREIRETILSLIQLRRIGEGDEFVDSAHSEQQEHITGLHNLALAVLANALNCVEGTEDGEEKEDDLQTKPRARTESTASICDSLLNHANDFTKKELLSTLIHELAKAENTPHNACLSAKSIGTLCRASKEARKRAKDLGAKNVVQNALEVGTRTHLKLQTECEKVAEALTRQQAEQQQQQEEQGQEQQEE